MRKVRVFELEYFIHSVARRKESTTFVASAVNSFSRNRFQMFNSTSRYLVYCTINRDTKRVTIILRYPRYSCRNINPREHRS